MELGYDRYASIVCNLERRRVVTLLPDREPATAQAWLAAHPTIAIVARDRGGGYGEAAAKALPHAVRKVLRSGETSFEYERSVQPRPKLGRWASELDGLLSSNAVNPHENG